MASAVGTDRLSEDVNKEDLVVLVTGRAASYARSRMFGSRGGFQKIHQSTKLLMMVVLNIEVR